ncbi:MAG: DUF4350 domain-containing protein [Methanophagales archaeon]|nr:DUF4350 domain-containing protein [Methanophagales archaeon]
MRWQKKSKSFYALNYIKSGGEGGKKKVVKKMAEKKKVITEVLSCLVVCMFLMSVVPVSIFAMNSNNNTILNGSFAAKSIAPEWECPPDVDDSGDRHIRTPIVKVFQESLQPAKILFIHDGYSEAKKITNTDWNGYSDLAAMLEGKGFTVVEQNLNPITLDDLTCYDIVVFSPSWHNREIDSSEAEALAIYVQNGGGLFLMGENGVASWSDKWDNSVSKVGKYFGIEFNFAMVCDPTDHYDNERDPDGGVDMPFITDISHHKVTDGVSKFMIVWGTSLQVSDSALPIAYTDSDAWLDTNSIWNSDLKHWECYQDGSEELGRFPVLAVSRYGSGKVVALGDSGLFLNDWLDNYDHFDLAHNIFEWLSVDYTDIPIKEEKQAMETLVNFSIANELNILRVLEIFSNNFTEPLFGESVEPSYEDYDTLYEIMQEYASHQDEVLNAIDTLSGSSLTTESLVIEAKSANSGIWDSIKDTFLGFFGYAGGAGKRARERILAISEQCPNKNELFEGIDPCFLGGAKNWDEFKQKLESGELDTKAAQIHRRLCQPGGNIDYACKAQGMNERPIDVCHKEGAELVKKGVEFEVEASLTVLGKTFPGITTGYEYAKKGKEYVEYVEKVYEDPVNTIKESVKNKVEEKFKDLVDETTKKALGEELSEKILDFTKKTIGKDKPSEILQEVYGYGTAILVDADSESKTSSAIAINKDTEADVKMVTYVGDPEKDPFYLPPGDYHTVAMDDQGNKDEVVDVPITSGQGTVVAVDTSEQQGEEQPPIIYSLSVVASPADPAPGQYVTVTATISPPTEGIEIYFHIIGTDGYKDTKTLLTNAEGKAYFSIPGAKEGVRDTVTVRVVETGQEKIFSYVF